MELIKEINSFWGIHFRGYKEHDYIKLTINISDANSEKYYEVIFDHYVAYLTVGDSLWKNTPIFWETEKICVLQNSTYLDFIKSSTFANDIRDDHEVLKHYFFNCIEHTIHVATFEEPVITKK